MQIDASKLARDMSVTDLIRAAEAAKTRGDQALIEPLYSAWIESHPDDPLLYAVLFNYSVVLSDGGKVEAARDCLQRAIAINNDFIPAYINLGRAHERTGNVRAAVEQWTAAIAKMPAVHGEAITYKTTALNQAARALEAAAQDEPAENFLRQSLEIDPHQSEVIQHLVALRQRQCEWPVLLPSERVDRKSLVEGMSPLSAAAYCDDPMLQLAMAANYNKLEVGTPESPMTDWPDARKPAKRLRIGYLSSDLREHAVGYLIRDIFALHDRNHVEVFAYYCGPESQDALKEHLKSTADHWTSITGLNDPDAANRIAADGIQILIDLNGYTREARLKLIALKPAPIIVNWLGYPGTMGSPYHHYVISDDWVIPPKHEIYYSEKVLRLPCYQPNSRNRVVAPNDPSRGDAGLAEDAIVYCCFNGTHKLSRATFDRWLEIIKNVPRAVLWLLGNTKATNERLLDYASRRGVARERIVFAQKLTNPFHLARYPLADLFLDTFPYGAHTTASDALWMGVPVLTLSGRSFASRVCGSLVRSAGIGEMICTSSPEYVQRAIALGNNTDELTRIRQRLLETRDSCTLFDTPLLVRRLEALLKQMWGEFERGLLPRPNLANLDAYLEVGGRVNHEEFNLAAVEDYDAWWRQNLLRRHAFRPMSSDCRLMRE